MTGTEAPALADLRQFARQRKQRGQPRPALLLNGARGLYETGASIREVAAVLEISKTTVHQILSDAGTQFRRGRPTRRGRRAATPTEPDGDDGLASTTSEP